MPLRAINAGHVEEHRTRRLKSNPRPSNRQVNLEKGLVSLVLSHAFRRGLVDLNEATRVQPLKETTKDLWLKPGEVDLVLVVSDN